MSAAHKMHVRGGALDVLNERRAQETREGFDARHDREDIGRAKRGEIRA